MLAPAKPELYPECDLHWLAKEKSRLFAFHAQTLDASCGIQFLVGGRGLGERWSLGTV
jgi:hypothetical protein